MSYLFLLLIAVLLAATFGCFAYNLRRLRGSVHLGRGVADNRYDNLMQRALGTLNFGFLQPKMFMDLIPGIMHAMIFGGFLIVSLGTLELLLHGVLPFFSYKLLLGDGFIYGLYLRSQDFGNFIEATTRR